MKDVSNRFTFCLLVLYVHTKTYVDFWLRMANEVVKSLAT